MAMLSSTMNMGTPCTDSSQDTCTSETSTGHTPDSSPSVGLSMHHKSSILSSSEHMSPSLEMLQKRRSSSRSIKRKKFDDELVESSFIKSNRHRGPGMGGETLVEGIVDPIPKSVLSVPLLPPPDKKKASKSIPKRMKRNKNSQATLTKHLGRWKPTDDLALVLAVQQTNDLEAVHRGVKFSCRFSLQEMEERWYALLYDQTISKSAVAAMKQLHPDVIAQIQARALFNVDEEKMLSAVLSTSQPTVETFQELVDKNPEVFLSTRTSKSLLVHWTLMKQYHLLPDQTVQPLPKGEQELNFSDVVELLDDSQITSHRDEALENEMALSDRRIKREIRTLENELPKWQVFVDTITGVSPPDFDNQTLAVLRGRLVRYLMRSREISIGRSTKASSIDVDLSLEGPAWKISRRQGTIKLQNTGEFCIFNEGKRPVFVDGKPVLTSSVVVLNNNCVVEIAGLRFIFLINQELLNIIRQEAAKSS